MGFWQDFVMAACDRTGKWNHDLREQRRAAAAAVEARLAAWNSR